jgi:hypothetical protein
MKRSGQDFADSRNDTHQLRHIKRTIAAAQRADGDPVVIGGMLGPNSSCLCIMLAKYVRQVQTGWV